MANENEEITSNDPEKSNTGSAHKHHSWLEEAIGKIDADFPLSGGETDAELESSVEAEEHVISNLVENTLGKIDTEFPLSGGETDADLNAAIGSEEKTEDD